MDAAALVGGGQEMTILREMNELQDEHDQYMDSLRVSRLGLSGEGADS
jgi:hypothetical protein